MIYFIGKTTRKGSTRHVLFPVITSVPAALQAQVKEILQQRQSFPINNGVREIIFKGTTREAIYIMGSESRGAVLLMNQTLKKRGTNALKQVVCSVEKEILNFEQKPKSDYLRLKNLIQFLGSSMEGKQELGKLLGKILLHIANTPPVSISTIPKREYDESETKRVDTNHCLLWIMQNMDQTSLINYFAPQLIKLTKTSKERWLSEINLAIAGVGLMDLIDLNKNLSKAAKIKPLRISNIPNKGHLGKIQEAYFSPNDKSIRTYGNQGYVCSWDLDTMKLIKRIRLPIGYNVMGTRPDGLYTVCSNIIKLEKAEEYYDSQPIPSKIVNVNTGKVISRLMLPVDQYNSRIYWRNNHEAIISSSNEICHFNYLKGKIIKNIKVKDLPNWELTEDGSQIFISRRRGGRFKTRNITIWHLNPNTGKKLSKTKVEQEISGGYSAEGLVPGGKYFYYADPNMYILRRKTGKLVAFKNFVNVNLLNVAFSPDGSQYAVVTGARRYVDDVGIWDSKAKSYISMHDTLSGKMLFACPSPIRFPKVLKFSHDGRSLMVSGEKFFEIWPMPNNSLNTNIEAK